MALPAPTLEEVERRDNMEHAYLILAHHNFDTLTLLFRLLDAPNNNLYLHVDAKAQGFHEEELRSVLKSSKLTVLPPQIVYWGGYSQIEATLRLVEYALKDGFDYCHSITGVDLPLKTQSEIDSFFTKHAGYEFINYRPERYEYAEYKCAYYHPFVETKYNRKYKAVRLLDHGVAMFQKTLGLKRSQTKFYQGSAYFSISEECAKYVLSKKDEIRKNYRYTIGADEAYLQTVIMNSPFKDRLYRFEEKYYGNAMLVDWDRSENRNNSPHTFRISDYDNLIAVDEGILFARKFDENIDAEIVKKIFHYIDERQKSEGSDYRTLAAKENDQTAVK
ncbi:Hypothetical protein Tpal_2076 [Trichococcus palustris]|uniref:Peptide O-xylosyltransferase n=2 Tax=Trichococcus palustris TaxID=140314 RepID=A0A143YVL7_9LACT|nr:Hypothetical protein Tpal_2076 [Trichococcus palustris]SFK74995.1 Core-2/I-Branching enzyme [Trichococcus palustris]